MTHDDRCNYTVKELAALAGVNPSRIRQVILEPRSPLVAHKRAGGWFISTASARRWLKSRER